MRKIGIICEYNPFHNGHIYHINKIKEMYKDSIVILVLSGNFTERGEISIIDKWDKTSIALDYVDLIIELPFIFATQSADIFAYGAVKILNYLKVDNIIFGSESDNVEDLKKLAIIQNSQEYNELVREYIDQGINYPTSMSKALYKLTNINLNNPNDLLGLSYVKAINKINNKIVPLSIKRTNDYHNLDLEDISSASAIRNALNNDIDIKKYVPGKVYNILKNNNLNNINNYFNILKYKILTEKDLSIYQTVDEGIEYRLKEAIIDCNNIDELVNKVKTKRYTYNKIMRMIIHILCSFEKKDAINIDIKYLRILGFNKKGRNYLNLIKKDIDIPIITNYKKEYEELLKYDINASIIYYLFNCDLIKEEYKKKPIIR